ncbi:MAG: hypothetical protein ACLRIL_05275 [Fusicatenibacter saccharivorans]
MLSEWNEYGLHPFHSTAAVQTVACACLNDWDGLILYNYQTSEKWDDQPADEILSVFDAYNDPAVACQWGFMASVFLKGLVAVSDKKVDVVYTQDDLKTLPNGHGMLTTMLPYITGMRNVFLDGGERYTGDADAAINAGFLNGADLSEAKKGVYYAWSPYRDAMRRYPDKNRLTFAARDTKEIQPGIHLGEKTLVFDKIEKIAGDGDYREFAEILDQAFKKWGIVPKDAGLVDGKMISVTKEMIFDPDNSRFSLNTDYCSFFSGSPEKNIRLTEKINAEVNNSRISISVLPMDTDKLADAKEFILTAMGETGMDETEMQTGIELMGYEFTAVTMKGKLFADTLEGTISVKGKKATLEILSPVGEVIRIMDGEKIGESVLFHLDGMVPGIMYHLSINEA